MSNDQAHAVVDAFAVWQNSSASTDTKGTVALIMSLEYIIIGFIYSQETPARPSAFDAFASISPLSTIVPPTNGTVSAVTQVLGASFSNTPARLVVTDPIASPYQNIDQPSHSHDYRASASKIDAQLYKDVYDFWLEQATAVNAATGANQTFTLQPITQTLTEASEARGGNPMGIAKEDHQCK